MNLAVGFIGSPGMNFINVLYKDGKIIFEGKSTLKVSEPVRRRLDSRNKFKIGDTIELAFNMSNAHYFDKVTEVAIS